MKSYTTTTREFGKVTFSAPAADEKYAGYVWIDGEAFNERKRICHGGDIAHGSTVQATTVELKKTAQTWLAERRRCLRKSVW